MTKHRKISPAKQGVFKNAHHAMLRKRIERQMLDAQTRKKHLCDYLVPLRKKRRRRREPTLREKMIRDYRDAILDAVKNCDTFSILRLEVDRIIRGLVREGPP